MQTRRLFRPVLAALLGALAATGGHGESHATLSAGSGHVLSIGTGNSLWGWGLNANGQVGVGSTVNQPLPTRIVISQSNATWSYVATGLNHSLAIGSDGSLWAWGSNAFGQVGDGTTTDRTSPVRIGTATNWTGVAAGGNSSAAIDSTGKVWVWGANTSCKLGQPIGVSYLMVPTRFGTAGDTPTYKDVAMGATAMLLIRMDGTFNGSLWAVGGNSTGLLGQGTTYNYSATPQRIGTAANWSAVAINNTTAFGINTAGQLYAWGLNSVGLLGQGASLPAYSYSPMRVGTGTTWTRVCAGTTHVLALQSNGSVWGWGSNAAGTLGLPLYDAYGKPISANIILYAPTQLATDDPDGVATGWTQIAGGGNFSVIAGAGSSPVATTGANDSGELGNGTTGTYVTSFFMAPMEVPPVVLVANAPQLASTVLGVNSRNNMVNVTVRNDGVQNTPAAGYVVSLYLSADTMFDPSDVKVAPDQTVTTVLAPNGGNSTTVTFNATISSRSLGEYYLVSQVNLTTVANPSYVPLRGAGTQVTLIGPDLALTGLTIGGGSTVVLGGQLTGITATLTNGQIGVVPNGTSITIEACLSTDTIWDSNDVGLVTFPYTVTHAAPGLGLNGTEPLAVPNLTVDTDTIGGSYYLLCRVNGDGLIPETAADAGALSNVISTPVYVSSYDLAVSAPAVPFIGDPPPVIGTQSKLVQVTVFAQNLGAQPFPAGTGYTVALYLSTDGDWSDNDLPLYFNNGGTRATSKPITTALASGSSSLVTFADVEIPDVTPGTWYMVSRIQSNNGVNPYEGNDDASTQVIVQGPDYTITDVILPAGSVIAPSGTFNDVTFNLRNVGAGVLATGVAMPIRVYLSVDGILDTSDGVLATLSFTNPPTATAGNPRLEAGPSVVTLPLTAGALDIPIGALAGGSYHLLFVANMGVGATTEGNQLNNVTAVPFTVVSTDLAVTAPTLPESTIDEEDGLPHLGINSTVATVSTFVQNNGSTAFSAGETMELYLSADALFDASDRLLLVQGGSSAQAGPSPLAGFGSSVFNWYNVLIPDVAPGNWYLLSRVTPEGGAVDQNLSNNVQATQVVLEGSVFSFDDLLIPNTSIDLNNAELDDFGIVTCKLNNTGIGGVPASKGILIEIFLSKDLALDRSQDVLLYQNTYLGGLAAGASITLSTGDPLMPPANTPNGIYQLLFVANGTSQIQGAEVAVAAKSVGIGVLDVAINAPAIGNGDTNIGASTTVTGVTVTVSNEGGVTIPAGSIATLWFSPNSTHDTTDVLLSTSAALAEITGGDKISAVTFDSFAMPNLSNTEGYLIAKIDLPAGSGLTDSNMSNNTAATRITLLRPNLAVTAINLDSPTLNLDATSVFSNVGFVFQNRSPGIIPPVSEGGPALQCEIFLSTDSTFEATKDTRLLLGIYTAGVDADETVTVPGVTLDPIPASIIGGDYYLIVVLNRNLAVAESDSDLATMAIHVYLEKSNAPGPAFDYRKLDTSTKWTSVADAQASGGEAWQSPSTSTPGSMTSFQIEVTGPTVIKAPWKILAQSADYVMCTYAKKATPLTTTVAGTLYGYQPSYQTNNVVLNDADTYIVWWTFFNMSGAPENYARVDVDIPAFTPGGASPWIGVQDAAFSKVNDNYVLSPELQQGEQSSISTTVYGPALVSFWWGTDSVPDMDTLLFSIDGTPALMPTDDIADEAEQAVISGNTGWLKAAFLIDQGPHVLTWTYTQRSVETGSHAFLDGLEVLTPTPEDNTPNWGSGAGSEAYLDVPQSNIDLAIVEVTAPEGTYLLDDAAGTSRLPVTVVVKNLGYPFSSASSWDPTDLEIHLSPNRTYQGDKLDQAGNLDSDDINLGTFAQSQTLVNGDQIIYQGDINLPFDMPAGDYYLILRFSGAYNTHEFTLANNTVVKGPGYKIKRAPNLVADNLHPLSDSYPYHPEDSIYLRYDIANTGLGTVLPSQPFKTRVELMGVTVSDYFYSDNPIGKSKVVKSYDAVTQRLYLPEAGAQYPTGNYSQVLNFMDLPPEVDILVALSLVPAGTPADAGIVQTRRVLLNDYVFWWQITVDVDNAIAESSETNIFQFIGAYFWVSPVPGSEDFGSFIGQPAFDDTYTTSPAILNAESFDYAAYPAFTNLVIDYALYRGPSTPCTLLPLDPSLRMPKNGRVELMIPPGMENPYLTLTFDFNVRATDVAIYVRASNNADELLDLPGHPECTVMVLEPPYTDAVGPHSLTGFGGLKDDPHVLSVEGNVSDVQKVYSARVTVRDGASAADAETRFMGLVIKPTVAKPDAPTNLQAAYSPGTFWNVVLDWDQGAVAGTYVIERSLFFTGPFEAVGSTQSSYYYDLVPGGANYFYRVRAVNAAGASIHDGPVGVAVPSN